MKKRIFSIVLTLCMLLSIFPFAVTASAALPDTTSPDTSGTIGILTRAQNRGTVAPVETYRIDGTLVGRKNTRPDATTHQLKNGKKVKVVR